MLVRLAKDFGEHPDWKTTPMIDYGVKDLTDLSYRMGQLLFYILYKVQGEEAFLETNGSFFRDYREKGATALQFVEHVKKRAGAVADRIFDDWVLTPKAAEVVAAGISREELVRRYR
jgi:aminopeptidase N